MLISTTCVHSCDSNLLTMLADDGSLQISSPTSVIKFTIFISWLVSCSFLLLLYINSIAAKRKRRRRKESSDTESESDGMLPLAIYLINSYLFRKHVAITYINYASIIHSLQAM